MRHRLGLGAQWIGRGTPSGGPTAIAATASRRLSASLRVEKSGHLSTHPGFANVSRSKRRNTDESQSDSDNEEESRAFAARPIAKRRRASIVKRGSNADKKTLKSKPDKRSALQLNSNADDSDGGENGLKGNDVVNGSGSDECDESEAFTGRGVVDRTDVRNKLSFTGGQTVRGQSDCALIETAQSLWSRKSWQPGLVAGVRKRKRIRSRQKNLRRDTRPRDKLPPHLNEETLARGRVRKHQKAGFGKVPDLTT